MIFVNNFKSQTPHRDKHGTPVVEQSSLRGTAGQEGIAAIFITILVLLAMFAIGISLNIITVGQQRISGDTIKSSRAYNLAEAGIEDALLRLKKAPTMASLSYNLNVGGGVVNVNIPGIIGGSRKITSQGNVSERIRKVQIVYKITTQGASFHYGAQVDVGGLEMDNNARIKGNVFSNGSVIATGTKGYIDNSIVVAKNGNKIKGLVVGENAVVYSCEDSDIGGNLTYVSGGSVVNCSVGGDRTTQSDEIAPEELPISLDQINEWKNEAAGGVPITNDVSYDGTSQSLGPVQIGTPVAPKNLIVTNNAVLKVTGTIYVTGNVIFSNNAVIELDRNSYGSSSGVIIADGNITVNNNGILRGSGEPGSYILILSTNNSLNPSSPAISVGNNAEGAIFYTTSGLISLSNNIKAREITGYKIKISNNAEIEYESGLQNVFFTSGPGGSWEVESWNETE